MGILFARYGLTTKEIGEAAGNLNRSTTQQNSIRHKLRLIA